MARNGKTGALGLASICAVARLHAATGVQTAVSSSDMQFFETRIRPVLVDKCYKCHSHDADRVKGGLMLDSREGLLHGGNTGAAITPGKPDDSLLIEAISYTDENLQMPPKGDKLNDQQIADFTEWIRRGAPDPRSLTAKGSSAVYGGVGKDHWSFKPVKKPDVPTAIRTDWCKTPVDNFVLAKLEANDMSPNPQTDKRTLIRRVTFDLIGLPPTEQEIAAFVSDNSPDAYAKLVDRLLALPQYGEHCARSWLDIARFADTGGDPVKRSDPRYPNAYTYRDYVIGAFNGDKPYNQFIIEQLAADRIVLDAEKKSKSDPKVKPDQSILAALGFLTLGNQFTGNVHDIINDRIDVTSKAFLGLTVACARCHDHKFDPIPTKDYYSLYGIFANTFVPKELPFVHPVPKTSELEDYLAKLSALEKKQTDVQVELAAFNRSKVRDPEKRKELVKTETQVSRDINDLEFSHPAAPPRAYILLDVPNPKDFPVLVRGEAQNHGDIVPRRFLEVLSPDPKKRQTFHDGSGRLDLAKAIASPGNPLTARVIVNRIWQQHFGAGFVLTPDDLGNMSSPPTHPELLDYLASRFVEDGWSIKKLQRLIVMSAVYQQSSAANPKYADSDPDNRLLWRYNLRRLDFEEMHDSLLAIAGTLDPTVGGKSVQLAGEGFATRRALYTYIDRRNPPELFTQFDFPNPNVPAGKRYETFVPQQSLFLMNSPLVIETARKLVHRPEFINLTSDEDRVASLYLAVFQRTPNPQETKLCLHYVESNPGGKSTDAPAAPNATDPAPRDGQKRAQMAQVLPPRGKNAPQGEPGGAAFRSRAPLDAWTKLAHALFQTNEAMFYN
ncbi:MAG TPA: PSD1 and planctomycete cytochrome C domain-containing protein [Opitutaceae bacterium]|nr:PSD1 and planctomycete cytochrome C domain-containing protein [Opitutaceae bacterium]